MAKAIVDDSLWVLVEPCLPRSEHPWRRRRGRQPIPDRAALTGILFILKSGIPWEELPAEMGCGSGMTCWRRLRDWHRAGAWKRVERVLRKHLPDAQLYEWRRAETDGAAGHMRPRRPRTSPAPPVIRRGEPASANG
ncbi:MAG: transposase [bacterium]